MQRRRGRDASRRPSGPASKQRRPKDILKRRPTNTSNMIYNEDQNKTKTKKDVDQKTTKTKQQANMILLIQT